MSIRMYSSICNLLHKYNFDEDGSFSQKHKTLIDHAVVLCLKRFAFVVTR